MLPWVFLGPWCFQGSAMEWPCALEERRAFTYSELGGVGGNCFGLPQRPTYSSDGSCFMNKWVMISGLTHEHFCVSTDMGLG